MRKKNKIINPAYETKLLMYRMKLGEQEFIQVVFHLKPGNAHSTYRFRDVEDYREHCRLCGLDISFEDMKELTKLVEYFFSLKKNEEYPWISLKRYE